MCFKNIMVSETNINFRSLFLSMKPKMGFLKFYLLIALLIGFLGILDNFFALINFTYPIYQYVVIAVLFLFFFFNLSSLFVFRHHGVERIAYVLPIYHLLSYLLFVGVGGVIAYLGTTPESWKLILLASGFLSSLFEVAFSSYLLYRMDFSPSLPH